MSTGIDRHALHQYFWRRRNRLGKVTVNQQNLADHLGVNKWTMSRIMHELMEDGRIRKIGAGHRFVGTFAVEDPTRWESM